MGESRCENRNGWLERFESGDGAAAELRADLGVLGRSKKRCGLCQRDEAPLILKREDAELAQFGEMQLLFRPE